MDVETGYLACLLEVGAPEVLDLTGPSNSAVATLLYMHACSDWYAVHIDKIPDMIPEEHAYFCNWWADYKRYLMDHGFYREIE